MPILIIRYSAREIRIKLLGIEFHANNELYSSTTDNVPIPTTWGDPGLRKPRCSSSSMNILRFCDGPEGDDMIYRDETT